MPTAGWLDLLLVFVGRRTRFRVAGGSMSPLLHDGDTVIVDSRIYHRQAPQVGDVVVAEHPYEQRIIVKRISDIDEDSVILRGDNPAQSTDSRTLGPFPIGALIGQVTARLS